jgi:NodT family efflux transporter outer membrane factor (OMF) lipoprotein
MKRGTTLSVALLLAACAVGPDYATPELDLPATFAATPSTTAIDEVQLAQWWREFDDPLLSSLIDRALAGNLELEEALARIDAARALRGIAAAAQLPQIDAAGGVRRQRLSGNALFAPPVVQTRNVYEVGFDSSWELDLFGRVQRGIEAAEAELAREEALGLGVRVRLAAEVARTYVEHRTAAARARLATTATELAATEAELSRSRATAGVVAAFDADRAEARHASAAAIGPEFESAMQDAAHRLAVLLGLPPAALLDELPTAPSEPRALRPIPVGVPAELLRRRPDLRAAERDLAAHTARIGVATAELYPSLSLTGQFAFASTSTGNLLDASSRTFAFGPALQLPLFRGGALRARLAAAEAECRAALARYEHTVLQACAEVESGVVAVATSAEQQRRRAMAVAAQRRCFADAQALYAQGVVDFGDVLDAERQLNQELDAAALAEATHLQARIGLFKALGGGWHAAQDIEAGETDLAAR